MPFVSLNKKGVITAVSERPFEGTDGNASHVETHLNNRELLGKKLVPERPLRVAVIANWSQECGISTYTQFLVDSLRPKVGALKVFSEEGCLHSDENVDICWKRGESMHAAIKKVLAWDPDFVLVQHEFGIFPKAPYLHQMLQHLDQIPYAVVLHSTYEHRDKSICTSPMKHIIVHTNTAKDVLRSLGNKSDIRVIPHGCVEFPDREKLWNINQTEHSIVQFGFGFFYKGVDRAIDAVAKLKEKYKDIYYLFLCSQNPHTRNIHSDYQNFLMDRVESLGLHDNVVILNKYNTDEELNNYLRVFKLAIFPYINNPNNVVRGASGAARIAMANGIPVIASESHLFDELPIPRPDSAEALATEIDKVFSDWKHKDKLIATQDKYIKDNNWNNVSELYLNHMREIIAEQTITSKNA